MAPPEADGLYSFLYVNGMRYVGRYEGGLREGPWTVLNSDGSRAWEITWKGGAWHGPATTWWKNGVVRQTGEYDQGEREGVWTFRFESGQLAACGAYSGDRKAGPWEYFDQDGAPMGYAIGNRSTTSGIGPTTTTRDSPAVRTGLNRRLGPNRSAPDGGSIVHL